VQYSIFAAPRWPLHPLLLPCVTAVALRSRYIRYFPRALQPLRSLTVTISRGRVGVFAPRPHWHVRSDCQCQVPLETAAIFGRGSDYLPLRCCCVTGGGVPAVAGSPRHDANVCGRPLALGQVLEHTERR
jgi:hypothetical protein